MFDEAISEFSIAIAKEDLSLHRNNRGLALYHIGDYERAKIDYDEAIKKNPDEALVYYNRGNVFLNQGEYELAYQDYDTAIKKDPKNPKFYHQKGLAFEA